MNARTAIVFARITTAKDEPLRQGCTPPLSLNAGRRTDKPLKFQQLNRSEHNSGFFRPFHRLIQDNRLVDGAARQCWIQDYRLPIRAATT